MAVEELPGPNFEGDAGPQRLGRERVGLCLPPEVGDRLFTEDVPPPNAGDDDVAHERSKRRCVEDSREGHAERLLAAEYELVREVAARHLFQDALRTR